jgi:hypothetical protein
MGQVLGPDGEIADRPVIKYAIGEFGIDSPNDPAYYLQKAMRFAFDALVRSGNGPAASKLSNPFQMEPGAQAVFMLCAAEFKRLNDRIDELEAKLDESSDGPGV